MALDEPKDSDEVMDDSGFTFVVDKDLWTQAKPVKIDMTYLGFQVSSAMPMSSGGCSSGSCSSGSCG